MDHVVLILNLDGSCVWADNSTWVRYGGEVRRERERDSEEKGRMMTVKKENCEGRENDHKGTDG